MLCELRVIKEPLMASRVLSRTYFCRRDEMKPTESRRRIAQDDDREQVSNIGPTPTSKNAEDGQKSMICYFKTRR